MTGRFEATVTFSEPVTGFLVSELAVENGHPVWMASRVDGTRHTVTIAPEPGAVGELRVTVPAGVAENAAGTPNTASEAFAIALSGGFGVTGLVLFDHETGRDVGALEDGAVLDGLASSRLNVRAEVAGTAGSVHLALSGPETASRTENGAPWYLFGDRGARGARAFPAGSYTLTATPWTEPDLGGTPGRALSVSFRVGPALRVTGLVLHDHATGADVQALAEGAELPAQSSDRLNIRAEVAGTPGSVHLALSGQASASRTENGAPWYLFGDRGARGARAFPAGSYTVTATPYPEGNLGGAAGQALSVSFRVKPHELSVADARAEEGTDETIDFTVTLAPSSSATVTVDYATADGTATAGEDYTQTSGTLAFARGETAKTIAVAVLDDAKDEGEETFTLRLSNASGAVLADAEATGTIVNSDPLQKMWLSRFGRTVAGQVVDAVAERLRGGSPGAQVTLGGQRIELSRTEDGAALAEVMTVVARALGAGGGPEPDGQEGAGRWLDARGGAWDRPAPDARSVTGRELLLGSTFHLATEKDAAGGPALAAWGRFATGGFEAEERSEAKTVRLDGEVTTGLLGVDAEWERWLAGVAVSVSEGEGAFSMSGCAAPSRCAGRLESSLTGVHPYVRFEVTERVSAWGLAGYGRGEMTMTEDAVAGANGRERPETVTRTDIAMRLGAAGARGALLTAPEGGGFELALRSDAFWVRMASEAAPNSVATTAQASRVRLILEGSRAFETGGGTLTPGLELGLRHDGGDAETGTGVEVGARLRYADPASGLTVEASARTLLAHEDGAYEEWGAGGSVRLDPGASGRGLSLSLAPAVGAASSGVERLWGLRDARALEPGGGAFEPERRLEAEVGYGLGALGGRGVQTPYAGLSLAGDGARALRLGWRLALGPDAALSLEGTRREAANDDAPEHGLMLRASLRW